MAYRQMLTLGVLGLGSLVPLCASASTVGVSEVFEHEPVGYWSARVSGLQVTPGLRSASAATGYYYGNSFRPLTVWVSDLAKEQSTEQHGASGANYWRAGGRVNLHPSHGHEGRYIREDGEGGNEHEIDGPGSNPSPVPLPASWILLLTGAAGLLGLRRTPLLLT